jgi:hypothetical protein
VVQTPVALVLARRLRGRGSAEHLGEKPGPSLLQRASGWRPRASLWYLAASCRGSRDVNM